MISNTHNLKPETLKINNLCNIAPRIKNSGAIRVIIHAIQFSKRYRPIPKIPTPNSQLSTLNS